MQSYIFTVDMVSNAVRKLAIYHELFLFAAFFFCVIVHVAIKISF